MRKEDSLTKQVALYLNAQYPDVIYHFDLSSGGKMSIGMAMRNKSINRWRGYPDLFIAKKSGHFCGLFIELKSKDIFKKDGSLLKDEHLSEQRLMLNKLMMAGYDCHFGIGFEKCKEIIDEYLNLKK